MTEEQQPPITIFYSYAQADAVWRDRLATHLSQLKRDGFIEEWYDHQILAGSDRTQSANQAIRSAHIILLLVSPDFLASDYCYDTQMQYALERHKRGNACVIPIILRPCDWQNSPLKGVQCLPHDSKPVTQWSDQDEAFLTITQELRRAIEQQSRSFFPLLPLNRQNRMRLLKQVKRIWIDGLLGQSLHQATRIELCLQDRPDMLANPWRLQVQELDQTSKPLPDGATIVQVYDRAEGELLILGEPGAGKTTLLLELARVLIERAERDERLPMPIVFHLSSWAERRQSLKEWLVEELSAKYQTPYEIGRNWVDTDQVLPLLDGLDEVAKEVRIACVEQINVYYQSRLTRGSSPIVVCCRSEEYIALPTRVMIQQVVSILPLTTSQINTYLEQAGDRVQVLRQALHKDDQLRKLICQPLMLNIFIFAYQRATAVKIPIGATHEEMQHTIFAKYVEQMLKRRGQSKRWKSEQVVRWLTFLAKQMQRHNQTVFSIEDLQPTWLEMPRQRCLYRLSLGLIGALVGSLIGELANVLNILVGGPYSILVSNLDRSQRGLLDVAMGALLGLLIASLLDMTYSNIKVVRRTAWSWKWSWMPARSELNVYFLGIPILANKWWLGWRWSTGGLLGGLLTGTICWLSYERLLGPTTAWAGMLFGVLFGALFGGFSMRSSQGKIRLRPNQKTWLSARNGLLYGMPIGLFFGASVGWTTSTLQHRPSFLWLTFGVALGLICGLIFGLYAFLRHFLIRFWLWQSCNIPWKLVSLLDEASDRLLLRKVGGDYIFMHRLLLDYFAAKDSLASTKAGFR